MVPEDVSLVVDPLMLMKTSEYACSTSVKTVQGYSRVAINSKGNVQNGYLTSIVKFIHLLFLEDIQAGKGLAMHKVSLDGKHARSGVYLIGNRESEPN